MIFGFNTDIKHGDTVFHVQSEARQSEQIFQTQVFVRGRCIGKHESSYALASKKPEFTDEHMQELLRNQHRLVLDSVRDGKVHELLGILPAGSPAKAAVPPTQAPAGDTPQGAVPISTLLSQLARGAGQAGTDKGKKEKSTAPASEPVRPEAEGFAQKQSAAEGNSSLALEWLNANGTKAANLEVQFRVVEGGTAVADARIFCRVDVAGFTSVYAQGNTDHSGRIELKFPIATEVVHQASMLVQATHDSRMATKKFRIP